MDLRAGWLQPGVTETGPGERCGTGDKEENWPGTKKGFDPTNRKRKVRRRFPAGGLVVGRRKKSLHTESQRVMGSTGPQPLECKALAALRPAQSACSTWVKLPRFALG